MSQEWGNIIHWDTLRSCNSKLHEKVWYWRLKIPFQNNRQNDIKYCLFCSLFIMDFYRDFFGGEGRGLRTKIKKGCLPLSVAFLITIDSIRVFSFTAFLTNMAYFSFIVLLLNWPWVSKITLIRSQWITLWVYCWFLTAIFLFRNSPSMWISETGPQ